MSATSYAKIDNSQVQRRAALVVLFGLWTCLVVVFNPMESPENNWRYVWLGAYAALPGLFAAWIALGIQPLALRIPFASGLAAFLGVMAIVAQPPNRRADIYFLLFSLFFMMCLNVLMLGFLRRRYGWEIHKQGAVVQSSGHIQFTIFQLLLWTSAAAVVFASAGLAMSDWTQVTEYFRTTRWFRPMIGVLVVSGVGFPLVVFGLVVVFGDVRRVRFGTLLASTVMLLWLTSVLLWLVAVLNLGGPVAVADSARAFVMPPLFLFGFVSVLTGSLRILRFCGYRMSLASSVARRHGRQSGSTGH